MRVSSEYEGGTIRYANNLQGLTTCYLMGAKFFS